MNPATWRTVFLVAVLLVVLWMGYLARAVVTPLLVALLLAYILDPVVRVLERRGLSRSAASASVVVVALILLAGAALVTATRFAREAGAFYEDVVGEPAAPAAKRKEFRDRLVATERDAARVAQIESRIREALWEQRPIVYLDADDDRVYEPGHAARGLAKLRQALAGTPWDTLLDKGVSVLSDFGPTVAQYADSLMTGVLRGGETVVSTAIGIFSLVFLFPIYLYYSLVNLARVYEVAVRHMPQRQRPRLVDILSQIHVTLSAFFRGRLITMLLKGVLLLGIFVAFGVPFSFVCAALAALASLVPVLGGIVAGVPPIVLSLHDSSALELGGLVLGIVMVEILEGYVLIPALVGKQVGLHPLTVLVCALVAGELLGFFGMIVAIPLTAVIKILAVEFVLPEVRRHAGLPPVAGDAPPPAPQADGPSSANA